MVDLGGGVMCSLSDREESIICLGLKKLDPFI